jgi:hypothetical protein
VPVQSSLPESYTSMQTGVYNGWIMFPSGWVQFKLYEVGKFYTETGFGAITWHGLTMNKARFAKLPKEVQDIILEVGREYEARTGTVNLENYPRQLEQLRANGVNVKKITDSARSDWANALKRDGVGGRSDCVRDTGHPRHRGGTVDAAVRHSGVHGARGATAGGHGRRDIPRVRTLLDMSAGRGRGHRRVSAICDLAAQSRQVAAFIAYTRPDQCYKARRAHSPACYRRFPWSRRKTAASWCEVNSMHQN